MPRTTGMPLTIDVGKYLRLPPDVRVRFDGWLTAESLIDKLIVKLTLTEGAVVVEHHKTGSDGRLLGDDGEPEMETATYPVAGLPPKEAFVATEPSRAPDQQ